VRKTARPAFGVTLAFVYPPEPWDLRGQLYLSVFAVPRADLPALPEPLASTMRRVRLGGRSLVGAAWVRYEPGGVLHYQELLSAVLVHEHGRPRVSILDIWVDSVASRDGGRELWGIPKKLAELDLRPGPGGGLRATAPFAVAEVGRGVRVPGRWPTPLSVAQVLHEAVKRTTVRGRAGLRIGRAAWRPDPGGPLGYLAGRRPLVSVTLADFRLRFGG
jgi:hypothetical protein